MLLTLALALAAVPNDYGSADAWLCRPGRADACAVDVGASKVRDDASVVKDPAPRRKQPRADCFYVYPTVSMDPTPNSDMIAGPEERGIIAAQFARFADVCRLYAPLYRQVTLTGLRALLGGGAPAIDRELGYADVRAAWRDYLAHDNHGRPFVLIGHSQGANALKRLVAEEIDGTPLARRMLSAILPGSAVLVPEGRDVGGDFKSVPLCRSAAQTGCVWSWASFRDIAPPPAKALFGRTAAAGRAVACTNPAAPAGGAAPLDAVLGFPWWRGGVAQYRAPEGWGVATRFVRVPGLLTGACVAQGGASYLAVHVDPARGGAVAADLTGPDAIGDVAYPDWGWHVVDMAIVAGDLVRVVGAEAAVWRAPARTSP